MSENKGKWDGQCVCGHLHSEHYLLTSHNYSAGKCTHKECRCLHFIHANKCEPSNNIEAMHSVPIKEKRGEGAIPEEIPKMSFELAGMSDVAAIEYGTQNGRLLPEGLCNDYDTGVDITEAHEVGQMWMYCQLQSQLSSMTAEKNTSVKEACALLDEIEKLTAERDEALKEAAEFKRLLKVYLGIVKPLRIRWAQGDNQNVDLLTQESESFEKIAVELLAKHKMEEHK